MAKKMYDIVPPKAKPKKVARAEALVAQDEVVKPKKTRARVRKEVVAPAETVAAQTPVPQIPAPVKKPKKAKHFPFAQILLGVLVVIILLGIYFYIKLPKADVEIWPETSTLQVSDTLIADKSVNAVNQDLKTIPAQFIQVEKDGQQNFPATGLSSNEGTATGTITVSNSLSPSAPFVLVSGTHFLSDSGEYFVSTQKVTVPAAKGNTPGSMNVPVQAVDVGASYNIGPSKFSLPKLSGTAYYYSISGASTSAMSGGYTGKVKLVTDDDISGASDVLTKQLLGHAETSLKNQLTSDEVLLPGASAENVVSSAASVKSGAVADTFNETARVTVSALVFSKQDVASYIKTDVAGQLSDSQTLLEESLQQQYSVTSLDMPNGKLTFTIQASIKKYQNIDTNALVNAFAGKSTLQIKQILDQLYPAAIAQLKVNFWPFWVTSAPTDTSRIKVNLNF